MLLSTSNAIFTQVTVHTGAAVDVLAFLEELLDADQHGFIC
jgi:hypothetical protein